MKQLCEYQSVFQVSIGYVAYCPDDPIILPVQSHKAKSLQHLHRFRKLTFVASTCAVI